MRICSLDALRPRTAGMHADAWVPVLVGFPFCWCLSVLSTAVKLDCKLAADTAQVNLLSQC